MQKIFPNVSQEGFAISGNLTTAESHAAKPRLWMRPQSLIRRSQPALSANQLTSISAMISYISHRSGQSEFRIERSLSDRFNIPNAKFLSAKDFDTALSYLADILPPSA